MTNHVIEGLKGDLTQAVEDEQIVRRDTEDDRNAGRAAEAKLYAARNRITTLRQSIAILEKAEKDAQLEQRETAG